MNQYPDYHIINFNLLTYAGNLNKSFLLRDNLVYKSYNNLISFVDDMADHDRRYAIDATKIEKELGWKTDENFESGIVKSIK